MQVWKVHSVLEQDAADESGGAFAKYCESKRPDHLKWWGECEQHQYSGDRRDSPGYIVNDPEYCGGDSGKTAADHVCHIFVQIPFLVYGTVYNAVCLTFYGKC